MHTFTQDTDLTKHSKQNTQKTFLFIIPKPSKILPVILIHIAGPYVRCVSETLCKDPACCFTPMFSRNKCIKCTSCLRAQNILLNAGYASSGSRIAALCNVCSSEPGVGACCTLSTDARGFQRGLS